MIICIHEITQN